METNLYALLAEQLATQIREGIFDVGEKMPSVRQLARREQVSIATVSSAYGLLEQRGWVEAKPKSGYYVRRHQEGRLAVPRQSRSQPRPRPATTSQLVMEVLQDAATSAGDSMCAALPSPDFPIVNTVRKIYTQVARTQKHLGVGYDAQEGYPALRQQIARRAVDSGVFVSPETVITTSGCQNSLALCLRAATQPGDIVAIESPCYYGLLQMIECFGLKAIEIPAHPDTGMSLEALQLAISQWPVKAVLSVATFSNPLGCTMPDERKAALVDLLVRHDIPMIEDDIYGDLCFDEKRPKAVKAFDPDGRIMLCSSLSKTIDPQLRVGWIIPGKYFERLRYLKFINTIASPTLPQMVTAEILGKGVYDRHLRYARETYRQRFTRLVDLANRCFPDEARLSRPRGGLVVWCEFPRSVNTTELYHRGHDEGVLFAPGEIFSVAKHYQNCLRLSFSRSWTDGREQALQTLGAWLKQAILQNR